MKKLLLSSLAVLIAVGGFFAYSYFTPAEEQPTNYTFIVPQEPGGGTSLWAEVVAGEMSKYLEGTITLRHIPGARDIQGFNDFHNELRNDPTVVMVSHGGNGVAFLQEAVDYDYRDYASVGLQNLNIIAGIRNDADPLRPVFAGGSGMTPETFAMTMLICGPGLTVEQYVTCFNDQVTWVRGMSGGERRLAFQRGELTATRENPLAYGRHVAPNEDATVWFHHGLLQADGSHADDPNYPGFQFETLFEEAWSVPPSGDFYNAYVLVKSFRDALQKALWVSADNPNLEELREALRQVRDNPESQAVILEQILGCRR